MARAITITHLSSFAKSRPFSIVSQSAANGYFGSQQTICQQHFDHPAANFSHESRRS